MRKGHHHQCKSSMLSLRWQEITENHSIERTLLLLRDYLTVQRSICASRGKSEATTCLEPVKVLGEETDDC